MAFVFARTTTEFQSTTLTGLVESDLYIYSLTFHRPKSDVENIDEDNDKDDDIDIDDIDEFDEDDLSYEGKEFFIRQCLLLRMKGNDQKPNIKYFYRPAERGVQLKGMGIRVVNLGSDNFRNPNFQNGLQN